MRRHAIFFSISLYFICSFQLRAEDICEAVAIQTAPAIGETIFAIEKGEHVTAITSYEISRKRQTRIFFTHGGGCYPAYVRAKGAWIQILRLTNCEIDLSDPTNDAETTTYSLLVNRSKLSPETRRYNDLDDRFLEMGLCYACSRTVAKIYIKQPDSRCAKLARAALEGNPVATKKLLEFPDYCQGQ